MKSKSNQKGKNNSNYKTGKYCTPHYCIDCGKLIDKCGRSIRCYKCANKGKRLNHKHTEETKKIIGKKSQQKFTKQYKDNIRKNHQGNKKRAINGYILIKDYFHPNRNSHNDVLEHRLVMEKHLGRYLTPEEVVHHINEIRDDNRIENLKLFKNRKEHMKFHQRAYSFLIKLGLERKYIKYYEVKI